MKKIMQHDVVLRVFEISYPLRPAFATFIAELCNPITCQPIELVSCSNSLQIWYVW